MNIEHEHEDGVMSELTFCLQAFLLSFVSLLVLTNGAPKPSPQEDYDEDSYGDFTVCCSTLQLIRRQQSKVHSQSYLYKFRERKTVTQVKVRWIC